MYLLEFKSWVSAQIARVPDRILADVGEILLDLRDEPYPADSKAMERENTGFRRIKVDGYRIVYRVEGDAVVIWKVGPRDKDTYTYLVE